jgi:hypothetical protein
LERNVRYFIQLNSHSISEVVRNFKNVDVLYTNEIKASNKHKEKEANVKVNIGLA